MQAAKQKRSLEKTLKVVGFLVLVVLILWTRPWGLWPAEGTQAAAERPQQEQREELLHDFQPGLESSSGASTNMRLRGLCECPELERPASFAVVRVQALDGSLERTSICDADGRFHIEWPAAKAGRIQALAGAAGWPHDFERELTDEELAGDEIRLSMGASRQLHGRIFDALTSEPAPELLLRLSHASLPSGLDLHSDAGGGFTHSDWLPADGWVAEVIDVDPRIGRLKLMDAVPAPTELPLDADWELRVALGPTYFLDVRCPEFDTSWKARLMKRSFQSDLAGRLEHRGGGNWTLASTPAPTPDRPGPWHGLRDGEPPWVRFGPQSHVQETEAVWTVFQLSSSDEDWMAESVVARTTGIQQKPLVLRPQRLGQAHGHVATASGEAIAGALVRLISQAAANSANESVELARTRTNSTGYFELQPVTVGSYTLQIEMALRPRHQAALELNSGKQELGTIQLGSLRPLQSIRGQLLCERDHKEDAALVRIAAADGGALRRSIWVPLKVVANATRLGSFSFDAVLDGSYELRAMALGGFHNWQPNRYLTQNSIEPIQFECAGFAHTVPLRITAHSKENNEPLDNFSVTSAPGKPELLQAPESQPWERWSSYPIDQALEIAISSPGKAPEFANENDFKERGTGRDFESVLSDGWGALILLREAPTLQAPRQTGKQLELAIIQTAPVEAVELRAGDQSFISDASGAVRVALKERPELIELRHANWRAIGLSKLEAQAPTTSALPQLVVWMRCDTSEP